MNKDNVVALLRKKNMEALERERRENELHHKLVKLRFKLPNTDDLKRIFFPSID
jgi:hypothetical protein